MKKSLFSMLLPVIIAVILMMSALSIMAAAEPTVKVSDVAYTINMTGANSFMCNYKPIDSKVGTEMYITYTVSEIRNPGTSGIHQQGLIGTSDPYTMWPYTAGYMKYKNGDINCLLEEGWTYFVKFVITENGFDYVLGSAKGEESKYRKITLPYEAKGEKKIEYFGIYLDGSASDVKLTNVHIYDKYGNDLGVGGKGSAEMREYTSPMKKANHINHTYSVTCDNAYDVYIGNSIKNTTNKMYIEYTCKSSGKAEGEVGFYQTGIRLNMPTITGSAGQYKYTNKDYNEPETSDLLHPGASYIIETWNTGKAEQGWEAIVQRTNKDGTVEWFKFNSQIGATSSENNGYSLLKFGEGHPRKGCFEIEDLRIYDANGKHLGAYVSGSGKVTNIHHGELLSYEGCDSIYYCKENGAVIAIYPDKRIEITEGKDTKIGTYTVEDVTPGKLTAVFGTEKITYDFYMAYLTDADGKRYDALGLYTLSFVTGTDEKIETQHFSNKKGYKPEKPADPKLDGDEFVCWVTGDGQEFDFNKIMSSSETVYAKWKNSAGRVYTALDGRVEKTDFTPFIAIGLAVVVLVTAAIGSILIGKRFKKHD